MGNAIMLFVIALFLHYLFLKIVSNEIYLLLCFNQTPVCFSKSPTCDCYLLIEPS